MQKGRRYSHCVISDGFIPMQTSLWTKQAQLILDKFFSFNSLYVKQTASKSIECIT